MSIRCVVWAYQQEVGSAVGKAILVNLAHRASSEGCCRISFGEIAKQTEITRREVLRQITRLEQNGLIEVVRGSGEVGHRGNEYRLLTSRGVSRPHQAVDMSTASEVLSNTPTAVDMSTLRGASQTPQRGNGKPRPQLDAAIHQLEEAWGKLVSLPQPKTWSQKRKQALRARLRDEGWLDRAIQAISCIPKSPFLMGHNDRGWRANIDWLLRPDSATRVLEGSYGGGPQMAGVDVKALLGIDAGEIPGKVLDKGAPEHENGHRY